MNKKGFTLVELLAVIAILAILVIIALPNVLQMFNNAKRNAFSTEVKSIYKQAQSDYIADSLTSSGPRYYCSELDSSSSIHDGTSKEKCKNLNLTTTKEYYVEMDNSGKVTYMGVKDNSFAYGQSNINSINSIDSTAMVDISNLDEFDVKGNDGTSSGTVDPSDPHIGEQYTAYLDKQNGTGGPSSITVTYGSPIDPIVTPTSTDTTYTITFNAGNSGVSLPSSMTAPWRFLGYYATEEEGNIHAYVITSNGALNTFDSYCTTGGVWTCASDVHLEAVYSNKITLPYRNVSGKTCNWNYTYNGTQRTYPYQSGMTYSPSRNITMTLNCN